MVRVARIRLGILAWALGLLVGLAACEPAGGGSADAGGQAADAGPRDVGESADAAPDVAIGETAGPDAADVPGPGPDVPGSDVFVPGGCCDADDDCADGAVCIGLGRGDDGICVPAPAAGACWERRHCGEGETCQGGRATTCLMSSLPNLGECVPIPAYCCWEDDDCEAGRECQGANELTWGPGECLLLPEPGACYRNDHCPAGTLCLGAQPCGCLVDCYWAGPGICAPVDGTCCFFDGDCQEGLHCVGGGRLGGAPGHCKPPLDDGRCWGSEDCDGAHACVGAEMCPCDADCDMEDRPGACEPRAAGCCADDRDCPRGLVCGPGSTCVAPLVFGACWTDADCYGTQSCGGATVCPCGEVCAAPTAPGRCHPLPLGCCFGDGDCAPGEVCRAQRAGDGPLPGSCVPDPAGSGCEGLAACCWEDADCGQGTCEGANVCGCIELCPNCGACRPDQMGICNVEAQAPCCFLDAHCAAGEVCVHDALAGGGPGKCMAPPEEGCWYDPDCAAAEVCSREQICPCDALCDAPDEPGICLENTDLDCCFGPDDCSPGFVCVPEAPGTVIGVCKPPAEDAGCWFDSDCGADELCVGVTICPCDADCAVGDTPGSCRARLSGCCRDDEDCGNGRACTRAGSCAAAPDFGRCWVDEDCGHGLRCSGASVCPCGVLCGVADVPGSCVPLPNGCCYQDDDCREGFVCRAHSGVPGELPGSCVPDPLGPECPGDFACCWDDGDCGEGGTCEGVHVCGCIALCPACGACADDQIGACR